MSDGESCRGAQDTGNPVLDSTVNYLMSKSHSLEVAKKVHALFLELAQQEPGGLKFRGAGGMIHYIDAPATTGGSNRQAEP